MLVLVTISLSIASNPIRDGEVVLDTRKSLLNDVVDGNVSSKLIGVSVVVSVDVVVVVKSTLLV